MSTANITITRNAFAALETRIVQVMVENPMRPYLPDDLVELGKIAARGASEITAISGHHGLRNIGHLVEQYQLDDALSSVRLLKPLLG